MPTQITDLPQAQTPLAVDDVVLVIQQGVAKQTAQANLINTDVQSDWAQSNSGNQEYIKNKPTLGTAAALDVGTSADHVVQLDGTAKLPAVDGSQLTNLPVAGVSTLSTNGSLEVSGSFGNVTIGIAQDHDNTWNGKQIFDTASVQLGTTTASTALVTDASRNVVSSTTTATELDYVHGVTSAIQTQLDDKLNISDSYTDGQLLIGNTLTGGIQAATITAGSNITVTNGNGSIEIAATGGAPGGSSGQIQYNNAGSFGGIATTGSGSVVKATSPTLVSPALGTPSALVGTNISGTAASLTAGAVTNATLSTALTVNTGTLTLTANSANTSVLTIGAGAVSVSGSNTGDQTITLTGDVTGSGTSSFATTLATVNSNVGSFGSSTSIPTFTVTGTGLITAASGNAVVAPASTLSGTTLASGVTASSLTSFGASIALGTPGSGTLTNCTFPTLNQNTTGSAASLSVAGQTGLITLAGTTSTSRIKTVRDAADTLLELGGSYTPSGTWTNLTMVTPVLGTPSSGTLTNCSGTAASLTAGNVTTNANLTGVITSVGNATSIASQTGTGTKFVVDTSPTLVTPTIGVATATSVNKMAITAPASSSTLAVADGKTFTASNTITLTGTDSVSANVSNLKVRTIGFSAVTPSTGQQGTFVVFPVAGTITGWSIVADTGTATVKVWKIASGTAAPTVSNNINTSGVALSTGTAIISTDVTDFTSTTVSANDIFAFNLTAVTSATKLLFELQITVT